MRSASATEKPGGIVLSAVRSPAGRLFDMIEVPQMKAEKAVGTLSRTCLFVMAEWLQPLQQRSFGKDRGPQTFRARARPSRRCCATIGDRSARRRPLAS